MLRRVKDRKSTRLNSSHQITSYAVFCLKKKNVYVGFMVWSNFTTTKCLGLVSLNQVIKEIICLQPLKLGDLCLVLLLAVLLLLLLVAPCLNCLEAVKKPPPVAFKVMCLLPITIL